MSHELRRAPGDIEPAMTDLDVLDFCKSGLFVLEGVIPDGTNRWIYEYINQEGNDSQKLVEEERFIEEVLHHPEVAGVTRSLLGERFQLPDWMANHRLVGCK